MIVTKNEINKVAEALKNNQLVIFPTETVYGIGASALSVKAVKKIFDAKGRASDNPLIVHVSSIAMIDDIATDITDIEKKLIENFFPGPFTIILKKKDIVPNIVTAGLDSVAVRMPSNEVAKDIIKLAGIPIAAPSANISGRPSGTNVEDIKEELEDKVSYILDDGSCKVGIESTVVKVIGDTVNILRPGYVTKEDILKVHDKVIYDSSVFNEVSKNELVLSPGLKYKHYAPSTKCILVENESNAIEKYIKQNKEKNIGIVTFKEDVEKYGDLKVFDFGSKNDLNEISRNIFNILRKVDKENLDLIIIQGVKKEGLGIAIMNRLIRACGHNILS